MESLDEEMLIEYRKQITALMMVAEMFENEEPLLVKRCLEKVHSCNLMIYFIEQRLSILKKSE